MYAESVHSNFSALIVFDFQAHNGDFALVHGADEAAQRAYAEHYGALNPWTMHGGQYFKQDNVVNGPAMCAPQVVAESEWYNDWGRQNDTFHTFGGIFVREGAIASYLTAARPQRQPEYGDEEIGLLTLLMPHLRRALQLHQRLSIGRATENALGQTAFGVVFVKPNGEVMYCNKEAERISAENDGFSLRRRIHLQNHEQQEKLAEAVTRATFEVPGLQQRGGSFLVSRPSLKRPYQVMVAPLPTSASLVTSLEPAAVVFIKIGRAHV